MSRIVSIVVVALIAPGCAGPQAFRPVEEARVDTADAKGTVADYDMKTVQAPLGDARVWAVGAYRAAVNGQRRTVLQVAVALDNESGEELAVESLHLGWVQVNETRYEDVEPIRIDGSQTIAPGADARLDAYFVVPTDEEPNDVEGFRLDWTVSRGEARYRQSTEFEQAVPILLPTPEERAPSDDFPPVLPPPPLPAPPP